MRIRKLATMLIAMIMVIGMVFGTVCACAPGNSDNVNPGGTETEQPGGGDNPGGGEQEPGGGEQEPDTTEAMTKKLADFKAFLTGDSTKYSIVNENVMSSSEGGEISSKDTVTVDGEKICDVFEITYGGNKSTRETYYLYDSADNWWYEIANDKESEDEPDSYSASVLIEEANSVDYVLNDICDLMSVDEIVNIIDSAELADGKFVSSHEGTAITITFEDDGAVKFGMSYSEDDYIITAVITVRNDAATVNVPEEARNAVSGISEAEKTIRRRLRVFDAASAQFTVETGSGDAKTVSNGYLYGEELVYYSENDAKGSIKIGEQFVKFAISGEDVTEIGNYQGIPFIYSATCELGIYTFYLDWDYYCIKGGTDGKVLTLSDSAKRNEYRDFKEVEIDYSVDGKVVLTLTPNKEGADNTVVTFTGIGSNIEIVYPESVKAMKSRVCDNVYYDVDNTLGTATARKSIGYEDIDVISEKITVGDKEYVVTEISENFFETSQRGGCVVIPATVMNANYFAQDRFIKIYYKGASVPADLNYASGTDDKNLVYLYAETVPTEKGFYWNYDSDGTIKEYNVGVTWYEITFHTYGKESYVLDVTDYGFIFGDVTAPFTINDQDFIGWYYDNGTWKKEFDPSNPGNFTGNVDVYARYETQNLSE